MKKNLAFVALVTLTMTSCSTHQKFSWRAPASVHKNKLFEILDEVQVTLSRDMGARECHDSIEYYWKKLYELDSKTVALQSMSPEDMDEYIRSSFYIRLGIKERLKELERETSDDKKCLVSVKRAFMALRYVEDYLIEYSYQKDQKSDDHFVTLTGEGGHFLVNPKYSGFKSWQDLNGGDVLLSRGNAFSSAAIARIGQTDTQFSHLSLVHKDKDKIYTSEAHIEIGNVVAPIDVHLEQKNARTVVFRHSDKKLSELAGKITFDHVKKAQVGGSNIEYDFGMDYKDESRLFCSEVVYFGYRHASKQLGMEEVDIPEYKTRFNKGLVPFLQDLGIKVTNATVSKFDTFGPGDIQFDSRFDIVTEWRNPKKLRDSRFKDAILTKLFLWMENENYRFHPTVGTRLMSRFSTLARKSDTMVKILKWKYLLNRDISKEFPKNMTAKQMRLFLVLDEVGEYFYEELDQREKANKAPLSLGEMFDFLESLKEKDYKAWKKYHKKRILGSFIAPPKPKFHNLFHP